MLPTGDSSQPQRQTLVEQNKGAKDDTSPKWPPSGREKQMWQYLDKIDLKI